MNLPGTIKGEPILILLAEGNKDHAGLVRRSLAENRLVRTGGVVAGVTGMITDLTERRQLEELKIRAFCQIEKNLEQLATLNDQIRNPLSVLVLLAEATGGREGKRIIDQAMEIDALVKKLDQGWAESAKVREFLKKHYQIFEGPAP